jgi:hypothetical protein
MKKHQVTDDYTQRTGSHEGDFIITELLVTRLGCEATRETSQDKNGRETVKITRKARKGRFNVHHSRNVSEGLHLVGICGEKAAIGLPSY